MVVRDSEEEETSARGQVRWLERAGEEGRWEEGEGRPGSGRKFGVLVSEWLGCVASADRTSSRTTLSVGPDTLYLLPGPRTSLPFPHFLEKFYSLAFCIVVYILGSKLKLIKYHLASFKLSCR